MMQDPLAQNFFSEPFDTVPSFTQARVVNKSILAAPTMIEHPQSQCTNVMQFETQSPYGLQEPQSPRRQSAMPQLGANVSSHGWSVGRPAANSSRLSRSQYSSNAFSYFNQPNLEIDDATSISSSAGGPSVFSLYDTSLASESFRNSNIECDPVYPSPFEQEVGHSSSTALSFSVPAVQSSFNDIKPWQDVARNSSSVLPCGMPLSFTHDGLPSVPPAFWPTQSGQSSIWSQQTAPPGTISPQALSLVAPSSSPVAVDSSPRSSSGWISETSVRSKTFQESAGDSPYPPAQSARASRIQAQDPEGDMSHAQVRSARSKIFQIQSSDSGMPDSKLQPATPQEFQISQIIGDNAHTVGQSGTSQKFQLQRSTYDRQHLTTASTTPQANNVDRSPDILPHHNAGFIISQEYQAQKFVGGVQNSNGRVLRPRRKLPSGRMSEVDVPPLSSNVGVLTRSHKRLVTSRSRVPSSKQDDSELSFSTSRQDPRITSFMQPPLGSDKSETMMTENEISNIMIETKCSATLFATEDSIQERIAKDKFLLDSKREGKSYKQIRLEGGFTEAESTLRGRHRTLTKKPEERVRKPEWESNDVKSNIAYVTNIQMANVLDSYAFSKRLSIS